MIHTNPICPHYTLRYHTIYYYLLMQVPEVDVCIIPVGGAGLIAGS